MSKKHIILELNRKCANGLLLYLLYMWIGFKINLQEG